MCASKSTLPSEHPFQKVFAQIEAILKLIEDNKHKPIKDIPPWVSEELARINDEVARFKQAAAKQLPMFDEQTQQAMQLMLRALPEKEMTGMLQVITGAEDLKQKVLQVQKSYDTAPQASTVDKKQEQHQSPLNLLKKKEGKPLSEKEKLAEMERRRKFDRIGGHKNWRPM